MRPFAPRPVACTAVLDHAGWRLKRYDISHDATPVDDAGFETGVALALTELPQPATSPGRSGVGFVIRHHGRGADYLVLGWWDAENELPVRVFVRREDERAWRPARGSESVCVWDLEVLWFERNAYVETLLSAEGGDAHDAADRYLKRRLSVRPSPGAAPPPPVLTR